MGFDKTGQNDHVPTVNNFGRGRCEIGPNSDNRSITHMNVTDGQIAEDGIHRQDMATTDDELAARW